MERKQKEIAIVCKYDKLLHHLHLEYPELSEISTKTLETFDIRKRKKSAVLRVVQNNTDKLIERRKPYSLSIIQSNTSESKNILFFSAQKCPSTVISRFQLRDIRNLIGVPKLQEKYEDMINHMFDEIKEEYLSITHASRLHQTIKGVLEIPSHFEIKPFKYIGKTDRYMIYLYIRKKLKKRWMLHQPLIRSIIDQFNTLPEVLFSIVRNGEKKFDFEDLEYDMQKNLFEASKSIHEFYEYVQVMVENDNTHISSKLMSNFLGSCTCALNIHLSEVVGNTLKHIVESTQSGKMPLLNLYVTYNFKMELFPTSDHLSELFQCLIKDTLALNQKLGVLHHPKTSNLPQSTPFTLYLTNEFINDLIDEVDNNVKVIYRPVMKYLEELNNQFEEIYSVIYKIECISDLNFEIGCGQIKYYNIYFSKVSLIPEYELFEMGILILSDYISKLQKSLNLVQICSFNSLASQNLWEMKDIEDSFEIIKTRAEINSITTEQTIEIGKYMSWVKAEFLQEAAERIGECVIRMAKLSEIGVIEDDHIDLNINIFKQLEEIEPIVNENLAVFEQLKFEAEEKLQRQIESINELTKEVHPILCLLDEMDDILNIRQYLCKINVHLLKIKYIENQIAWINDEEIALSFPKSTYPEFEELKNYVYPFYHLMKLSLDVQRNISVWLDGQFDLQSFDGTKFKLESYHQELGEMQKNYRKKLRQAQDENLVMRFRGTVDDPDILNWPAPLKICTKTLKLLQDFKPCISLMKIVCNPSLKTRHWKNMSSVAYIDLLPSAGSTLRKLMTYDLDPHLESLEIISQGATHEQELYDIIEKMQNQWLTIKLEDELYGNTKWTSFTNVKYVISLCEEDMEKLLIISRSAFICPHKDNIAKFQKDLVNLKQILNCYLELQEKFFHLLPLFAFMKNNKEKIEGWYEFQRIKLLKKKLYSEFKTGTVFNILLNENILKDIQQHNQLFENVYYGVENYLNSFREKFARYYFLSNEELIEMLSNAYGDYNVLQYFFTKCFKCIVKLEIREGKIIGIKSANGEFIEFCHEIPVQKNLIDTFRGVEKEIFEQMRLQISNSSKDDIKNKSVFLSYLGQVVYIAFQVILTMMDHQALHGYSNDSELLLQEYTTLMLGKELSNTSKIFLKNVIISLIHHKDYISEIMIKNITDNDFSWLSRIKYYLENDKCILRVLDFSISYGYEFFGSFCCNVPTFYTERANISILNAYNQNYNTVVHGKATVGKTEIFRQLGIALGVNCIILSCSKILSYNILERFLMGSSKAITWICLDDVNTLTSSNLSMASDLLNNLLNNKVTTPSTEINFFVGMTLNTTLVEKTDLPASFRCRLRNIGMISIDFGRLSEVSLISIGFKEAKAISSRVNCIFHLMPNILLEKPYDFSINLLKSILRRCDKIAPIPLNEEMSIVVDAIQQSIQPMLTESDASIFTNLLENIFGCISKLSYKDSKFKEKLISSLELNHLYPCQSYIDKILHMLDAITTKQSIILLGNIYSGKTNAIKILYNCLNVDQSGLHIINPVTFDITELFGYMDAQYNIWCDGIITKILRRFSTKTVLNWLVFDGPIEPNWIEALYCVLDERKVIVLGSGELLSIEGSNSILFEVTDLCNVSPTIISRCTLIYYETSKKPWITLVKPWIIKNYSSWPESIQHLLRELFYWLIPALLKFTNESCKEVYSMGSFYLVNKTVNYVTILLSHALAKKDEDIKNITIWLQASVFQGIYNSFTSSLKPNYLVQFDQFFKQLCKNQNAEYPLPSTIEKIDVNIPTEGLFSEYFYIYKGRGTFKYILDTLKNEKMITERYTDDILVPTSDTMRNVSILNMHVTNNVPILLLGPTGQGKTLCIKHFINHVMDKSKFSSIFVKFIPRLTPKKLQSFIKSSFIKKISFHETKIVKKNLIVIEDLNVCSSNKFKVSSVIEFLRQIMDHSFWYDEVNFEKKHIENLAFVASMGLNGKLSKNISPRLMKHFSIFHTNSICSENIQRIFTNTLVVVWKQNGFASDIALLANTVVNSFWCIYEFCCTKFRSSPLKFSYSYSIWDFRKALSGLFLLKKESADTNKKIYQKLWIHECIRVFGDRLVDTKEKNMLFQKIIDTYENTFKESLDETFNDINAMNIDKRVIFGCSTNLKYEEIDLSSISEKIREILKKCPILGKNKIVLFEEFLIQVLKISRILSIDNSNVLIMGMHGTGRKTLTEIASIMHNCHLFVPPILYEYNISKWHENFKKILLEIGGRGNKGIMYLNEEHFKYQFILEDINSFMKNGDLIDLFEIDEEPMILNLVRLDAQHGNPNLNISSESVYAFFVNRCREKLHIIMSFSCESNMLERRIHLFQSLTKFCTAIWFNEWSDNAIMDIASEWIKDTEICDNLKVAIPAVFVHFYQEGKLLVKSVFQNLDGKYSITTAAYIEFLEMFVVIMNDELIELNKTKEKYLTGLRKLKFADNQIRQLQESLAAYQLQLKIMTKKAAQMTRQIAKESLEVERASDLVKKDEQVANKQAEAAAVLKLDCEADLAQAIPILEDAIQALNTLKPSDITLVKSMKNPPDAIKLVMAAVCVIKDVKPDRIPDPSTGRKLIDYWGPSKRILGDMNFLQTLKDFDKDHIKSEIMVKIRKDYLPHKDFKPHVVAKASSAAEGLCKWIIAMDMYDNVAKEVAPKKDKLEKAEKEYAQTIAILNDKKAEVDRLEKQLAKLSAKLQEANKRQNRVQRTADGCNAKLERSLILISGFENEKMMWTKYVTDLNHKRHCLVGDVILTSATISYLSSIPSDQRRNILKSWHYFLNENNVPRSDDWSLDKNLTSMGIVDSRGLPEEDYFIENCIIYNYSYKSPLFIDPHGMAKKWIQRTIDDNLLHIIKYRHSNLVSEIEHCLKSGKYLFVENIEEEFTSAFHALLHKDITGKNNERVIIIEGKQFKYDKHFKLFMSTTLRSLNHKSQLSSKVKIINFSLTKNALQKKLLNVVIKTENALVGKQMNIYKKKNISNKKLLQKYEDKILKTLSEAENDLLEDNKALKILDDTKKLSGETGKNDYISEKFVVNFEKLKVHFSEFSHHASMLFFCIEDFWKIKGITRFSVQWFLRSYRQAILEAPLSGLIEKRVQNVTSFFIYKISRIVLRMVHEKDALNFLFHLSFNILLFRNEVDLMEIDILYKREKHEMKSIAKKMIEDLSNYDDFEDYPNLNKVGKYIPPQQLLYGKNIGILEKLKIFKGLQASMKEEKLEWELFLSLKNPEKHQLPGYWTNKLNTFQKFLLVQTLRPDRTNECIKTLVSHVLGEEYILPRSVDFEELYAESFCLSPILLLISDNNSPLNNLKNFAIRKKFYNKFRAMCLSETNSWKAENLIREGQKGGLWVCLLNCHLSKSWLFQLESICEAMTYENTNENFRLWLLSDISFNLPETLVEKCVKIIYEYSECFKENLLVSYKDFSDDINIFEYQKYSQRITRLIYRVICFHWVILWRQKYDSLGWNYSFNFSNFDLKFATREIPQIINTFEFDEALKFFIGECSYSGQTLDPIDHRLSNILMEEFLSFNYVTPFSFPSKNDIHDFTDQIKKLPNEETAEMMCCNDIVLTRKNIKESRYFTSYILSVGGVWNNNFDSLQVIEMVDNIMQLLNVEIEEKNRDEESNDSLKIILHREIQLYVKLVGYIKHTLLTLKDFLSNNQFLPPDLQDIVSDLRLNKISKLFFKYAFMTDQSFSTFIHSLRKRLLFFKNWNDNGTPDSFWISSFFYPNSFLSLQNTIYARKIGESIRNFSNIYVIQGCTEFTNGINIYGLYLMNAKYKKFENSVELLPAKVYFDPMPSISIIPVFNRTYKSFVCPVYRINSKAFIEKCHAICKNLIFSVYLQSTIQNSTLTKLGVSFTCECP